jgi:hypothetical protein
VIFLDSKEVTKEMLKVFSNYVEANHKLINTWQEIIFLSPRWWIGLLLGLLPWILWWKLHYKQYTGDLLRAGFFMSISCLILDAIGVQLGLWFYPYDVFPFIPGYFPWDLTLLPLSIMFMIQLKPNWSPLIKSLMYAFLVAFVGEPLAVIAKIYEPIHWKHYYSFPFYIVLFLTSNIVAKGKIFNSKF